VLEDDVLEEELEDEEEPLREFTKDVR